MSSCVDIREELKAFADGELTGSVRGRVIRHVEGCAACGRELEEIRSLGRTLRDLDTAVPRPELRSRILSQVPVDLEPARRPDPWWRLPTFALGSAAAALLLFFMAAPRADKMEEDLTAAREQSASAPAESKAVPDRTAASPRGAAPPAPASRIPAPKSTDSVAAPLPANLPPLGRLSDIGAAGSAASAPRLATPEMPAPNSPSLLLKAKTEPARPAEQPGDKPRPASEPPAKTDAAVSLTPQPAAPPAPPGPAGPQGPPGAAGTAAGAFGGGQQPPSQTAPAGSAIAARVQGRGSVDNLKQLALSYDRTETLDLALTGIEEAANVIITAAQEEGGKPIAPEKQADPGADELIITLLVPAAKVEALKTMFLESRANLPVRDARDRIRDLGAAARQRSDNRLKNLTENRAYFGYLAPQEKAAAQQAFGSIARENLRAPQDHRGGAVETEAARKPAAAPASPRMLSLPKVASPAPGERAVRPQFKKDSEEMVRLIIKLRTPPKSAPEQKRGKE